MDLLSLLFPKRCPYCRKTISGSQSECDECRSSFPEFPVEAVIPSGDKCTAPFRYEGKYRSAIIAYKFSGVKSNAESLAKRLAWVLHEASSDVDIVCWVPVSGKRRSERGFDQSELLAAKTAGLLNKECIRLLKKIKHNAVQHELSKEKRNVNVIGVYSAVMPARIKGRKILLIDDVCTTGNTLSECCRVLYSAGAGAVICGAAAIASYDTIIKTG